jgi:predicted DsbA family dithiol-disulfide isomerase
VLVEIWSDVVCPWCYVGKRHFEEALSRFPHRDEVSVVWRSFELDPAAPVRSDLSMAEVLQRKYGMTEDQAAEANTKMTALAAGVGLEYHLDRVQRSNTLDAHRLIHLAATHGLADAAEERLFSAYFTEGAAIGDRSTLVGLGVEVGLDAEEVERMLDGDDFIADVRSDEARATALGAGGVPFFAIDERYGVAGAQPADALLDVLDQAWAAMGAGVAER